MTAAPVREDLDLEALERRLAEAVDGEVRFDSGTRAAYSTDGSNFRQLPIGVVVPRTIDDAVAAIAVCREVGAPIVSRGGGTSLAGQCTNTAVMIDWVKYCNRVISIDADNRCAVVEPGVVLDDLNADLAEFGLEYGPRPSTHPNCTLGGMIGNNSCGATAQRTGKVVDNIRRMEVLLYDGTRFWCGPTTDDEYVDIEHRGDLTAALYRGLRRLRDEYADDIRSGYPDIPRRVSGYNLDSLLPEKGFDVAGLLVGSESTLVTVLRAELELVPVLPEKALVVVGYRTIAEAADDVPRVLQSHPTALEGLDDRLIRDEQIKHLNPDALDELPDGDSYLMVQFGGKTRDEVESAVDGLKELLGHDSAACGVSVLSNPDAEEELWHVREAGLGATAHVPGRHDTWEGWEDSAVAPERLGDYLRDLQDLYQRFGYVDDTAPSLYGHFGQGCVHTRIPFDLTSDEGVAHYHEFLTEAAGLVTRYGGSLSGEHGDGQGRGEFLPIMFGDRLVGAFEELKALFDPANRMNPGKVVHPYRADTNLRLGSDWHPKHPDKQFFAFPHDDGSFVQAANRCVGVGKCRQHTHADGMVMCPSYQATGEEEHSTRGRARLLFEMLDGHGEGIIDDGWRSTEVRDALDLCLSCKGCKTDCPVNVDMATYKAEFLAHHYAGRLRPRAHYTMGWLPLAALAVDKLRVAPVVNALTRRPAAARVVTTLGGLEHRAIPQFAPTSLQRWWNRRRTDSTGRCPTGDRPAGDRGTVMLWPDTFTNRFHPEIGRAAVHVLEDAGWTVTIPGGDLCCGLTWISTGQLDIAKKVLTRTIDALADHLRNGGLIVGLEPSCTAVFRSDAIELLGDDDLVKRLRDQTLTLAELLCEHTEGWSPQVRGDTTSAIVQTHCHQHAVMGVDADRNVMKAVGIDAQFLDSGCCGLAGNFGFEPGHLDVSVACAEQGLLPAIRSSDTSTTILADGFSCRTQIAELAGGRTGTHLAQAVSERLTSEMDDARSSPSNRGIVAAGALGVGALFAAGIFTARRRRR